MDAMTLFNVFGGLAIFIFGMQMMSDGLNITAGEKMRSILRLFSANRFVGILSGAAVTAVIQSSSASTVMVIGFINAGLLNLTQAMGIIFGANIGTTITAQLVAFDISWIVMPSIIIGLILGFFKQKSVKGWGVTVSGLGFLFLGMGLMSDSLKGLSSHPAFMQAFQTFKCAPGPDGLMPVLPLLGAIGVGIIATLLIQSSSACTGIVVALGASGLLDIYTAVALVLGSNVGTTVTAQLAAITANRLAKQAALAHTMFNVFGVLLVLVTFLIPWEGQPAFFHVISLLSSDSDLPRQIANAHTVFNVFATVVLVFFIPLFARLCEWAIPVAKDSKVKYHRLEPILLETPTIALAQTTAALHKMVKKSWEMVYCAFKLYDQEDKKNQNVAKRLAEREERIDARQQEITEYLSSLMLRNLVAEQAGQIPLLLHCTNDAERIGDHASVIQTLINQFHESGNKLSPAAEEEYNQLLDMLREQTGKTLAALEHPGEETKAAAMRSRSSLLQLIEQYEFEHIQRVNQKLCNPAVAMFYLELLSEINKISRHMANIAERSAAFETPKNNPTQPRKGN